MGARAIGVGIDRLSTIAGESWAADIAKIAAVAILIFSRLDMAFNFSSVLSLQTLPTRIYIKLSTETG